MLAQGEDVFAAERAAVAVGVEAVETILRGIVAVESVGVGADPDLSVAAYAEALGAGNRIGPELSVAPAEESLVRNHSPNGARRVAFDGGDPVGDGGALLRRVGELLETFGQGRVNVDAPVGAAPKTAFRIFVE